MKEKYNFLQYLLKVFKKYPLKTKLYLMIRILIFPAKFFAILDEKIKKDDKILDVGCGFGITTLYLQYRHLASHVLGTDIDANRITQLKKLGKEQGYKNVGFEVRDLINDGFKGLEGYNKALLTDLLHHIDKDTQDKLLTHLSANVDVLLIKDIDIFPRYKYYRNMFHDKYVMRNEILHFQGSKKIKKKLEDLGYKVHYEPIWSIFPYPHYLLIAKK